MQWPVPWCAVYHALDITVLCVCDPKEVTKLSEYLFLTEQMGWKKGLKVLGEKGEEAIENELQQIHDMDGFTPKHWHQLTKEERVRALKYLMYLKEKRDGKVKGRGCADGRPQRLYTDKIETSSPTAALTAIMLTCMIDAYKNETSLLSTYPAHSCRPRCQKEKKMFTLFSMEEWLNYWQKLHGNLPRICQPKTRSGIHILPCERCHLWNS